MKRYILVIDQSTSGTKGLLLDESGKMTGRVDREHRQLIEQEGWVAHDPEEIYQNVLTVARDVLIHYRVDPAAVCAIAISNQRETAMLWDAETQRPLYSAVVWQCSRAQEVCNRLSEQAKRVHQITGLPLSPYFSGAKLAWILEHVPGVSERARQGMVCAGTMDSWLVFRLTGGKHFCTDYSNASRTQLFDVRNLCWSDEICRMFGLEQIRLPQVCDSNAHFGSTDLEGLLPAPVPIHAVLGDSHGALYGQGCHEPGMTKTTYGTGSSVMMNVGTSPVFSRHGVVTSLAWGIDGKITYVLEGNINYTGAVMKWVTEDLGLLASPRESGTVAASADPSDTTYLVPAFSGLGAPYWNSSTKAMLWGMTRKTGRAELVKAAEECVAYQIADIIFAMQEDAGIQVQSLRVDGGPTKDEYLMQFQSDLLKVPLAVPKTEELSGIGAGYLAGRTIGLYHDKVFETLERTFYHSKMTDEERNRRYEGWQEAIRILLK